MRWHFLLLVETETILCTNSTWKQLDFLMFSPELPYCEKLFWDRLGCFIAQPRMFGGQTSASGHGQQKGVWCWDIASSTLSAKGHWWAVVDNVISPTLQDVRWEEAQCAVITVCWGSSGDQLGGSLCTKGVIQEGLSHSTQLWFAVY